MALNEYSMCFTTRFFFDGYDKRKGNYRIQNDENLFRIIFLLLFAKASFSHESQRHINININTKIPHLKLE